MLSRTPIIVCNGLGGLRELTALTRRSGSGLTILIQAQEHTCPEV